MKLISLNIETRTAVQPRDLESLLRSQSADVTAETHSSLHVKLTLNNSFHTDPEAAGRFGLFHSKQAEALNLFSNHFRESVAVV